MRAAQGILVLLLAFEIEVHGRLWKGQKSS